MPASDLSSRAADATFILGGSYRSHVRYFSNLLGPYLDRLTEDYVKDAIARNHAENNPELKELLTREIRTRPDGPGQNLDVIDSIPRNITLSLSGIVFAFIANITDRKVHNPESRAFKWLGIGSASAIVLNQTIETLRSVFRFMSGMQGSEEYALRQYYKTHTPEPLCNSASVPDGAFAEGLPQRQKNFREEIRSQRTQTASGPAL